MITSIQSTFAQLYMDTEIINYKEILVSKSERKHTYYFRHEHPENRNLSVTGHYIIDDFGNKWMSIDAISLIFPENYYEILQSKYYDVNNTEQKLFYLLPIILPEARSERGKAIMHMIKSNIRQGSPRKFVTLQSGEKVNIELPIETISKYEFK